MTGAVSASAPIPSGQRHSPAQIFAAARAREEALSRLLMAFVSSGLLFMLFPGTFLGVWNLLQISGRESVASVSAAWLQAHGHAQVFGWVGSFILGIGFYSIPKLRSGSRMFFRAAWACWAMWTAGVAIRWSANIYFWHWRALLPFSACLETGAFLIFLRAVFSHRGENAAERKLPAWVWVVISASVGLLAVLSANLVGCLYVSFRGTTPAFPHVFDQRFLSLMAWGFLVPFVWGFSAKWLPVFLGLRPSRGKWLLGALAMNLVGVGFALGGSAAIASSLFLIAAILATVALRIFEPPVNEAKTRGIHQSFPVFIRVAYGWLLAAAALGAAASRWDASGGIWGASRHALTVGFISVMILCVGQRVLPAFAGMRILWSKKLMFAALLLLALGCALRVSAEVLAYQEYASWAWKVLPLSALTELAALTLFAVNLLGTFILQPSHAFREAMVTRIASTSA